jgi:RNase H-fold protein (predicted Holliday junction resolvase)
MNQPPDAPRVLAPILAIDPGRDKCGLAVVDADGSTREQSIVARRDVVSVVLSLCEGYNVRHLVLGHATASGALRQELQRAVHVEIATMDETGSTLEARALYWEAHPPRGWRRLVPLSLQVPPQPLDDFAAVVLARRFLSGVNDDARNSSTRNTS